MPDPGPDLVAATYLEVAAHHRRSIEFARRQVAQKTAYNVERALVEIDDAMREVLTDDA